MIFLLCLIRYTIGTAAVVCLILTILEDDSPSALEEDPPDLEKRRSERARLTVFHSALALIAFYPWESL